MNLHLPYLPVKICCFFATFLPENKKHDKTPITRASDHRHYLCYQQITQQLPQRHVRQL